MNNEIILILCGLAGVLFHSTAKAKTLYDDAITANLNFYIWKDYIKRDAFGITLSIFSVGIWYLIFGEVIASYPSLTGFARTSFVVMGVVGSYALQLLFSRAKKKIREVVDQKTNTADANTINPKTNL